MFPYFPHLSPADNLLCVLRTISSDGQITYDEAWSLADWLNHNRSAAECWPGSGLVPFLQDIWEDGQLTADELTGLQELISSIEAQAAAKAAANPETTPEVSTSSLPPPIASKEGFELPQADAKAMIRSSTGEGEYEVHLNGPTCTCPDWLEHRASKPPGSPARACKHVVEALFQFGTYRHCSAAMLGVLENCQRRMKGTYPEEDYLSVWIKGQHFVLSCSSGDWVNLIEVCEGGLSHRYGYNMAERRWAYGESPKGARPLRVFMHEVWPAARLNG